MNIHKYAKTSVLALIVACGCSATPSKGEKPHWSYSGETGPSNWADLHPDWAVARDGKEQSPIDIAAVSKKNLSPIEFRYQPSRVNVVNNGHTIQFNYDAGSSIQVDGETYQLLQFHFHAPSEHTIRGQSSEMEVHFVHKSADGRLAVVGVMINAGAASQALGAAWDRLPAKAGKRSYRGKIHAADLLPAQRMYYTYPGSLTTPPCSEGVKWLLLTTPTEFSASQVAAFTHIFPKNNRPVQPLRDRMVKKSR